MASSANRSFYFDNAKFILIFLVVFGHVISPLKSSDNFLFTLYAVIFLFHMPAFILISGYFSKGYRKKGYLQKVVKKILLPYLVFQVIYSLFYYFNGQVANLAFDLLQPHWTLWFLLSLFFWNLLLYAFARLKWVGLVISLAIGVAVGYLDDAGSYLSLSRTFVFFPYFLLGFLLEPQHMKLVKKIKFSPAMGLAILLVALAVFHAFFPKDAVHWLLGDTSYAQLGVTEPGAGIIRFFQYLITFIVIYGFLALVPTKGNKFTVIGQRTFYIYLLHGFIIKTIQTFVDEDILSVLANHYLVLTVFSLGLCLFLGSYAINKYARPLVELRI